MMRYAFAKLGASTLYCIFCFLLQTTLILFILTILIHKVHYWLGLTCGLVLIWSSFSSVQTLRTLVLYSYLFPSS